MSGDEHSGDEQGGPEQSGDQVMAGQTEDGRVYVVSPRAMAVESAPQPREDGDESAQTAEGEGEHQSITDMVSRPDKVMRIATMTQKLLDEIKQAPLDDPSRQRLGTAYARSIEELKSGLDPSLAEELERITEPFAEEQTPTDAELRIAQAQLVGWLEGLFQGIQTALFAQQMAARAQLEQLRRALPAGEDGPAPEQQPGPRGGGSGMYL